MTTDFYEFNKLFINKKELSYVTIKESRTLKNKFRKDVFAYIYLKNHKKIKKPLGWFGYYAIRKELGLTVEEDKKKEKVLKPNKKPHGNSEPSKSHSESDKSLGSQDKSLGLRIKSVESSD